MRRPAGLLLRPMPWRFCRFAAVAHRPDCTHSSGSAFLNARLVRRIVHPIQPRGQVGVASHGASDVPSVKIVEESLAGLVLTAIGSIHETSRLA